MPYVSKVLHGTGYGMEYLAVAAVYQYAAGNDIVMPFIEIGHKIIPILEYLLAQNETEISVSAGKSEKIRKIIMIIVIEKNAHNMLY